MKILVLNASPKGNHSTTVHTALYLQALHPEHEFTVVPVGQRIKSYVRTLLRCALSWSRRSCCYSATRSILSLLLISFIG